MTFWQDLREHFETILIVAGIITLVVNIYQFCLPTRILMAIHHRIVAVADWASHGSWLRLLQEGIHWVLGVMRWLYGPPRDGIGSDFRQNLTVRAWKMSAWIATLIIFITPPLIVAIGMALTDYITQQRVTLEIVLNILICLGVSLFLAIPFALTWRAIRRDDEFLDHAGIEDLEDFMEAVIREGTKFAIVIAVPVSILVLIPRYSSNRYPRAAPVGIDVRDGLFLGL